MSSRLLQRCGEALFGSRWQTDLAAALGVNDRTVRRWASGAQDMPRGAYSDLHRLVLERAADLDDLEQALKEASTP